MENEIFVNHDADNDTKSIVMCSCGGGEGANHPVGIGGCFRYHVTELNEIPRNRRRWYNPEWFEEPVWI